MERINYLDGDIYSDEELEVNRRKEMPECRNS